MTRPVTIVKWSTSRDNSLFLKVRTMNRAAFDAGFRVFQYDIIASEQRFAHDEAILANILQHGFAH